MRKISAWVAIAAVPTMIAGIYGMNFDAHARAATDASATRWCSASWPPSASSSTAASSATAGCEPTARRWGSITDVPGVRVGHATRAGGGWLTGVTVVLPPPGTVGAVDVRGGGPGTHETDALDPTTLVPDRRRRRADRRQRLRARVRRRRAGLVRGAGPRRAVGPPGRPAADRRAHRARRRRPRPGPGRGPHGTAGRRPRPRRPSRQRRAPGGTGGAGVASVPAPGR